MAALLRFQTVCDDFGVCNDQIQILATEATRTAINSAEFRAYVKKKTGLEVGMLSKEEEGNVGAMGIVSSFSDVRGLVMDLGGGSAQVTWIISQEGHVRTSPKVAISFPYGAAAISKRLKECKESDDPEDAKQKFRQEIRANFRKAYQELEIPRELVDQAEKEGGFHLYLSGGGFRGWGYLLLSQAQKNGHHYPISIINGFKVYKDELTDTEKLKEVAQTAHKIFRVSDRRRYQVPAVAFLINVLANTLPNGPLVARFCQGGVREGLLFRDLPPSIRAQDPIAVASAPYACRSAVELQSLLLRALPIPSAGKTVPPTISPPLVQAFANLMYEQGRLIKESASVAALYSTSTGILASAHGLSHSNRARLALMLENRWDGEIPPRDAVFKSRLCDLLTPEEVWWCNYLGIVAWLTGEVYPAGTVGPRPRLGFSARWAGSLGKKGKKEGVELTVSTPGKGTREDADSMTERKMLEGYAKEVAKVGKRKNWIGGRDGWGMAVRVLLAEDLLIKS